MNCYGLYISRTRYQNERSCGSLSLEFYLQPIQEGLIGSCESSKERYRAYYSSSLQHWLDMTPLHAIPTQHCVVLHLSVVLSSQPVLSHVVPLSSNDRHCTASFPSKYMEDSHGYSLPCTRSPGEEIQHNPHTTLSR